MVVASAFLTPFSYPRLRPLPAAHILLHSINTRSPNFGGRSFKAPLPSPSLPLNPSPSLILRPIPHQLSLNRISHSLSWRMFCNQALFADAETGQKVGIEAGEGVRKFKKRLRIADVRGGPDEGLDMVGQSIAIRGWVRTCRVQSIVTFIEVRTSFCNF